MSRLYHLALCVFVLSGTVAYPKGRKNTVAKTLDGATILAQQRLSENPDDPTGKQLIDFVLALAPDNEDALLLLSMYEDGTPIEAPEARIVDNGKEYSNFLVSLGSKYVKSKKKKTIACGLLFYAMAKAVNPRQRAARLGLMRAKRSGVDTEFADLLAAYKAGDIDTSQSSSETGGGKVAEPSQKVLDVLRSVTINEVHFYHSNPTHLINNLNQQLFPQGVTIVIRATNFPVSVHQQSGGIPWYSSGAHLLRKQLHQMPRMQGLSAEAVLKKIAVYYGLGYKFEDDTIVITDSDDPEAASAVGLILRTEDLVKDFNASTTKALKKYKGKAVSITGESGARGKNIRGIPYIEFESGKVRALLGETIPTHKIEAFVREKERLDDEVERRRRYDRNYKSSYILVVTVDGVCKGRRSGKVLIDECTDISWYRTHESQRP